MTMTRRWIVVLGAIALGGLALGAAPACERSLLGAPCPCTEGWACCSADNTCHPAGTACTGGDGGPILLDADPDREAPARGGAVTELATAIVAPRPKRTVSAQSIWSPLLLG